MSLGFKLDVDEKIVKRDTKAIDVDIVAMYDDSRVPEYKSKDAVGVDLHAYIKEKEVTIKPHETVFIGTGIKMQIPSGIGGFIFARSGLSCKEDLAPANKVGVVDPDYRGEIKVALHNHGSETRIVKHDDRIAQMVFMPYFMAKFHKQNTLTETERSDSGFGHSGK